MLPRTLPQSFVFAFAVVLLATALAVGMLSESALAAGPEYRSSQDDVPKRYLIVNADDLGLSEGVTEGIVRAWREGVVTSTSRAGQPRRGDRAHSKGP